MGVQPRLFPNEILYLRVQGFCVPGQVANGTSTSRKHLQATPDRTTLEVSVQRGELKEVVGLGACLVK